MGNRLIREEEKPSLRGIVDEGEGNIRVGGEGKSKKAQGEKETGGRGETRGGKMTDKGSATRSLAYEKETKAGVGLGGGTFRGGLRGKETNSCLKKKRQQKYKGGGGRWGRGKPTEGPI